MWRGLGGTERAVETDEPCVFPPRSEMVAGKQVFPIIFGTARYAAEKREDGVIIPRHDRDDEERDLLRAAVRRGFNFFDTAARYGDSEILVGEAVQPLHREQIVIATKVGQMPVIPEGLQREIEASIERLNTTPDILLIHDRWQDHMGAEMDACIRELVRAQKDGLARAIGVSNFRPRELERAIAVSQGALTVYQAKINLLHPRPDAAELLEICRRNKIIFMASSALDRGKLINGYANQVVREIAEKYQMSIAQVAIFAVLALGALPIVQTHNEKHMAENRKVLELGMDHTDVERLREVILGTRKSGS